MMFLALFFIAAWETAPRLRALDLEDLGFYRLNNLTIHKMGANYVICSDFDHLILVVDAEGKPVAKYDVRGHGPEELHRPMVLGVGGGEILAVSNETNVIAFDGQLRLKPARYPPMPVPSWGGVLVGKDRFFLRTDKAMRAYGFTEVALESEAWAIKKRLFAIEPDPVTFLQNRTVACHNGIAFVYGAFLKGKEGYEVEVHDFRETREPNIVQVLRYGIGTIPGIDRYESYLDGPGKRGDKYYAVVYLGDLSTPTPKQVASYLDVFSESGDHLERRKLADFSLLIPVQGADELFLIDGDAMALTAVD